MDGFWLSIGSDWVHIWFIWLWHEFRWSSLGAVVCGMSLPGSTLAQLWCSWFSAGSGNWPRVHIVKRLVRAPWPKFIWFCIGSDLGQHGGLDVA